MKLSQMIFVIVIMSMELQGAANVGRLGTVAYRSAAVIPVARRLGFDWNIWNVYFFKYDKTTVGANLPHHEDTANLFTDLSATKRPDEHDPAITAARALFAHQKQFTQQDKLAEYLRRSPRIDMQSHIVYIAVFDEEKLKLPNSSWAVNFSDFIDAARRRFDYEGTRGKKVVHDPTGMFLVLLPRLAEGLATPISIEMLEKTVKSLVDAQK